MFLGKCLDLDFYFGVSIQGHQYDKKELPYMVNRPTILKGITVRFLFIAKFVDVAPVQKRTLSRPGLTLCFAVQFCDVNKGVRRFLLAALMRSYS